MRDIRFRAWRPSESLMVYPGEVRFKYNRDKRWYVFFHPGKEHQAKSDDFALMQFTGLKDKNGVEIYEGDIVQFREFNGMAEYTVTLPVVFVESRAEWTLFSGDNSELEYYSRQPKDYKTLYEMLYDNSLNLDEGGEVIGNIYSNPELLK